ncbi:hypothetical protein GCM10009097_31140 [Pigmentiphaga daeguensis]|uniref:Uncharacterized protein n=1 Tax=Pigmentiphaga daeguensis TaxID=414049 RepID=A0ABN1C4H8_9BURK
MAEPEAGLPVAAGVPMLNLNTPGALASTSTGWPWSVVKRTADGLVVLRDRDSRRW